VSILVTGKKKYFFLYFTFGEISSLTKDESSPAGSSVTGGAAEAADIRARLLSCGTIYGA